MAGAADELKELLHRCVSDHVHRAHRAYELAKVIGDHAWKINGEGFGELFHTVQLSLADEMVLSLTRLLESNDPTHPRHSIPTVLEYLEQQAGRLQVIRRERLEQSIVSARPAGTDRGIPEDDEGLTREAVAAFRRALPRPKTYWIRRDKKIAHAAATPVPEELQAEWDDAAELIRFAQSFAAVIGESYGVGFFENSDGTYMFAAAAEEASLQLLRLLERSTLMDTGRGQRPTIEHRGLVAEAEDQGGFWVARVVNKDTGIVAIGDSLDGVTEELMREIDSYMAATP